MEPERRHLYRLAGQAPPAAGHISQHIPPSVQRLLDQLSQSPIGVHDAAYNLISWNPLWAALASTVRVAQAGTQLRAGVIHGPAGRTTAARSQKQRLRTALVWDLRSAAAVMPATCSGCAR